MNRSIDPRRGGLAAASALVAAAGALAGAVTWPAAPAAADAVVKKDGTVVEGKLSVKPDGARVETAGGTEKIAWDDVARIRQDAPVAGLAGEERAAAEESFEQRLAALPAGDAKAAVALAEWAVERGLPELARKAWDAAATADPRNEAAQRGLGRVEVRGQWRDADEVYAERLEKLGEKPTDAELWKLAYFFGEQKAGEQHFEALVGVLTRDAYHEKALKAIDPYTKKIVHRARLAFPLEGRWKVSEDPSAHHQKKAFALWAIDLLKVDEKGRHCKGRGRRLEDHHAFGEPVYAAADGVVVDVKDGFPDNPIGKIPKNAWNNHNGVALMHGEDEYSWYIHLEKGSVTVELHEQVKKGQLLGRVGNSGGSSQPHLHFAVATRRGIISIPIWLDELSLVVDGRWEIPIEHGRIYEGDVVVGPKREGDEK